ncbi:MAG: protein-glutamate O-methyltransferase CheR [Planctomycetes bacterium]|nr:protein-glutamate O-methyltransferase CheR [Planctomycetota bacterium]
MDENTDIQYSWFTKKFSALAGLDLAHYKCQQMKRRIKSYMQAKGASGFADFLKMLENNPVTVVDFKNFLTINVSYFFRDTDKWDEMSNNHVPALLSRKNTLAVWSAGCSIGCEPYTFAIMFEEMRKKHPLLKYSIFATDVDLEAVAAAKAGMYAGDALKSVRPELIRKYFTADPGGKHKINGSIANNIKFSLLDLHKGRFEGKYDIIACRNVVIYFEENIKYELYGKFHSALNPGGILFLGGSEIIFKSEELGFKNISMCFYQKV